MSIDAIVYFGGLGGLLADADGSDGGGVGVVADGVGVFAVGDMDVGGGVATDEVALEERGEFEVMGASG